MDKKWFKMILLFFFYIKYLFFDFFFQMNSKLNKT